MRFWKWFTRPAARWGWGVLVLAGALGLGVFAVGANAAIEYTNRTEFCVSCHEMQINYEEYKHSSHYMNRTGVRVECADCHVPKEFGPKMAAKVIAVKDVWHTLIGSVDTPEKFHAARLGMAERVWAKMEATDSRECRTCHAFEAMDLDLQGRRSSMKHPRAMKEGQTCIECHKGIVHELPDGFQRD